MTDFTMIDGEPAAGYWNPDRRRARLAAHVNAIREDAAAVNASGGRHPSVFDTDPLDDILEDLQEG